MNRLKFAGSGDDHFTRQAVLNAAVEESEGGKARLIADGNAVARALIDGEYQQAFDILNGHRFLTLDAMLQRSDVRSEVTRFDARQIKLDFAEYQRVNPSATQGPVPTPS